MPEETGETLRESRGNVKETGGKYLKELPLTGIF